MQEGINWIFGIFLVALLAAFFASIIPRKQKEREKFNDAATTFRSKVLNSLEGIYPVTRPWSDESLFPKFQQSVPKVETAGVEFRPFIKHKTEFDAAVKEYHDYCQQRKYEKALAWSMYPNSPKPPSESGIGPAEEFKNIVEHILSFANEK